jgi:rhomboid protease GluP
MCQACRGLIDSSARVCPLCGRESVPALRVRTSAGADSSHFFSRLILSINVALFVLMGAAELASGGTIGQFLSQPSSGILGDFGSRELAAIQAGQWWRLITPIFLHLSVIHLMFNSIALFQIGPQIEEVFGSQKFIFLYLATGFVGNIGSYVFGNRGAGASGAIMGLIGIAAVYGYRMGGPMGQAIMRQMTMWAAVALLLGAVAGFDNANHIWGLLSGAGLAFVISAEPPETVPAARLWNSVAVLGAILIALSFGMVALNYGKMQRGQDVVRLDHRVRPLIEAVAASLNQPAPSADDAGKLASRIRSAASDVEGIPHFDPQSDSIRQRLLDLAGRRAAAVDSAKTGAALGSKNLGQDSMELNQIQKDYVAWVDTIKDQYGLIYQMPGSQ